METIKRLLKEFWLPLLLAISWTAYNLFSMASHWSVKDVINIFGPTFFLLSWITGQFFRIRKQALTERNFEEIIDIVTGGDTFPFITTTMTEPYRGARDYPSGLFLTPRGQYSLYDLTVIVTDIEQFYILHSSQQEFGMNQYLKRFQLGTLGRAYEQVLFQIEPSLRESYSFHIQSFARNGQFNERLLLRKVGDKWTQAHRVTHNRLKIEEYISADFPDDAINLLDPEKPLL